MSNYEWLEELSRYTQEEYGINVHLRGTMDKLEFVSRKNKCGYCAVVRGIKSFEEEAYDFVNWVLGFKKYGQG